LWLNQYFGGQGHEEPISAPAVAPGQEQAAEIERVTTGLVEPDEQFEKKKPGSGILPHLETLGA